MRRHLCFLTALLGVSCPAVAADQPPAVLPHEHNLELMDSCQGGLKEHLRALAREARSVDHQFRVDLQPGQVILRSAFGAIDALRRVGRLHGFHVETPLIWQFCCSHHLRAAWPFPFLGACDHPCGGSVHREAPQPFPGAWSCSLNP